MNASTLAGLCKYGDDNGLVQFSKTGFRSSASDLTRDLLLRFIAKRGGTESDTSGAAI